MKETEIFDDENSLSISEHGSTDDFEIFPNEKTFKVKRSYDDDYVRSYQTYQYKISTEPIELHIRLLESSHTPPEEFEVRDGVVLESEIKGLAKSRIPLLKEQVNWKNLELLGSYELNFYILSKHSEILPETELRKFLRQTSENIQAVVNKVEEVVKDNKIGLKIISSENGHKSIFYPETETLIKEWDEYRDLMVEDDKKKNETAYAKKVRACKKFSDPLFDPESGKYVGLSRDTFERSAEITQYIESFLNKDSSLFYSEDTSETENSYESGMGSKTKWFILIVLCVIALYWGLWTAVGVFVLGVVAINLLRA